MKLEEAIKQSKPFKNQHEKVIVNLLYTHGWLSNEMKAYFSKFGITTKQYNILRILKGAGKPVSNAFIRERMLDKLSDVSRIIDRMDNRGWILKKTSSIDKRLVDVKLSKAGNDLLEKINDDKRINSIILKNLSSSEARTLNNLLDKLRIN